MEGSHQGSGWKYRSFLVTMLLGLGLTIWFVISTGIMPGLGQRSAGASHASALKRRDVTNDVLDEDVNWQTVNKSKPSLYT